MSRVFELIQICFQDEIDRGFEVQSISFYQELISRKDVFLLIHAIQEEKVVGFAIVKGENHMSSARVHLLGVDPHYRQRGVGSKLHG